MLHCRVDDVNSYPLMDISSGKMKIIFASIDMCACNSGIIFYFNIINLHKSYAYRVGRYIYA